MDSDMNSGILLIGESGECTAVAELDADSIAAVYGCTLKAFRFRDVGFQEFNGVEWLVVPYRSRRAPDR